jgi:hypothetical protein
MGKKRYSGRFQQRDLHLLIKKAILHPQNRVEYFLYRAILGNIQGFVDSLTGFRRIHQI